MAINARFGHKIDTYSNWMGSDLVLLNGEFAIATIPEQTTESGLIPPAIGVKVGDGTHKFSELAWIQATAGDVYAWAKAPTVREADGLEAYIQEVANQEIQDTNTTYSFSFENNILTIKSKEKTEDDYTVLTTIPIDLTTKVDKVTGGTAGNIVMLTEGGGIADSGEKIGDYLKTSVAEGTYATKAEVGTLEEKVTGIDTKVNTLVGEDTDKSVRTIAVEEVAKVVAKAPEDFDTLKEIADWIQNDTTGAAGLANDVADLKKQLNGFDKADSSVKTYVDNQIGDVEEKITEVATAAIQTITGVENTKNETNIEITGISTDLLKTGENTLIFYSGTATEVI